MLAGCSSFVLVSLLTYTLVVWPHFVFYDTYKLRVLALACGFGMIPALVAGAIASRRFGLAGAGGFIGGSLAAAIFLYLNLKRILLLEAIPELNRDLPKPEFPTSWQYVVPGAWMLLALLTAGFLLRSEEITLREK